jgi:hypothetical protein
MHAEAEQHHARESHGLNPSFKAALIAHGHPLIDDPRCLVRRAGASLGVVA